ncbi:hypothetical protein WG954_06955 [Lacibacter sp. H375]|uniref:DUF6958 family protein n=1 Tax=Lacibacter sp. H375 TaxID=3133424 RepID=UPI0030C11BDD
MAKATSKKIMVTHPVTGTERKFDADIYEPVRAAILQSLKGSKGKTFTELSDDVAKIIRKKMPGFKGSIPWYTVSIRLDLETKGLVETFVEKGTKLNRLTK